MRVTPADFYRQNEWANLVLLEACRGLTDQQLDATASGTYGSIRDTLIHIIRAEGGYATELGHEPEPRQKRGDAWPGLDALAAMASAAAESLIAAAANPATERILDPPEEAERYSIEPAVILTQAFHHSTEHRSQIATVLTSLGIEPPDMSAWRWGIETGRMSRLEAGA